ncbi:MFS transporter [Yinghuangia seranimata]|uniref:MFS transporter n=1 Tax=Yinghuangia seranimata TaxID=408067 RepID=UPI00248BABFC|nr:MFS transporter [Yinghuangia seranimata]MDI2126981.1 MFS transporter [Yinghuangia seranimata]
MAQPAGTAPNTRDRRAYPRTLALALLCAGMLMVILDGTIVTVALPSIGDDLGFSQADLAWVMNVYMIAFGGLLLLAGRLGDLFGRKRMFLAGLAVFTVASLLCGVATNPETLLAARFLQGAGGAMASAVSLGMIVTLYPEPTEQGKAIGAFSFIGAAGASLGLVLGGVLTEAANWHWIFLVNLPIGVVTLVLAARVLDADGTPAGDRGKADVVGAALVTGGLMLLVYAVVKAESYGWSSPKTWALVAGSLALLALFTLRQARTSTPLLPLRTFRSRNVSGANALQVLTIAAMFGFQVLVVLYMQHVLGYGAAKTGWAMFPAAFAIGAVSLGVSARAIGRFGARNVLVAGLLLLTAGMAYLARVPVHGSYAVDLLPVFVLLGGGGLVLPALATLAMSDARPEDAGVVSGLFNTTQQIGAALGVALLNTLSTSRADTLASQGRSTAEALTGGYHLAFTVGTVLLGASAVLALLILRTPPTTTVIASNPTQAPERTTTPAVHVG